jgi:putative membrane protein
MISAEDHARIAAAIRAAEAHTRGEIVCVLARGSSAYTQVSALWAAAIALATPWPLIAFTGWSVQRIFLCQVAAFIVSGIILSWRPLLMRLVPRPVQRARAHREALEQFYARGMTRTRSRCGVLIFVSLAERYARVVADEGIAARVGRNEWQGVVDALVSNMRQNAIADGFVAAIGLCGAILADKAPPDGERDMLPDRLYVI